MRCARAGLETWFDASELARDGLVGSIGHLPGCCACGASCATRVLAWKPDVFVGIDARLQPRRGDAG
jgi:lipid-A-disaccharide synthase